MSDLDLKVGVTSDGVDAGLKETQNKVQNFSASSGKAMNDVKLATAGTTREFIVLAHEVVSGNFSRIPGSLMVLAERAGSLHLIVERLGAAFFSLGGFTAVAAAGLGAWAIHAQQAKASIADVEIALAATGQESLLSSKQIEEYIDQLSKVYKVSRGDARDALSALAGAIDISTSKFDKLEKMLPDVATGLGVEVPEAAKILAEAMNDPVQAMQRLQDKYNLLSASQLRQFQEYQKLGDKEKEQDLLIQALTTRFGGFMDKVEDVTKKVEDFWHSLKGMGDEMQRANNIRLGLDAGGPVKKEIDVEGQEQKKRADALVVQRQQEDSIKRAIVLQATLNDYIDKEQEKRKQIGTLQKGLEAANARGDVKDAESFRQSINAIQQQITQDEKRANNERLRDYRNTQTQKLEGARTEAQQTFSLMQEKIRMEAELGQISGGQELAILQHLEQERYNIEMKSLQEQIKLWQKGTGEYQKVLEQQKQAQLKHETEVLKIQQQALQLSQRQYSQYTQALKSGLSGALTGMLSGTMTWRGAMSSIFMGLLSAGFDTMLDKMITNWLAAETTKTAATEAGNTTRLASDTTAAATANASKTASALADIQADAARTFAGVYAFMAPLVGPAAVGPATASMAEVQAMSAMVVPSFDVGSWSVPNDTLAMVHKKEMIVPRNFAEQMRNGDMMGGGGDQVHLHVHALDANDVRRFLKKNSAAVADSVKLARRNGKALTK